MPTKFPTHKLFIQVWLAERSYNFAGRNSPLVFYRDLSIKYIPQQYHRALRVARVSFMQRRYDHVVTHVTTSKDDTITGKTFTNNRAEKGTQHIQRNTLKTSPLCFPIEP